MGYKIQVDGMLIHADTLQETLAFVKGDKIMKGVGKKPRVHKHKRAKQTHFRIPEGDILELLRGVTRKNAKTARDLAPKIGCLPHSLYAKLRLQLLPKGKVKTFMTGTGAERKRYFYTVGK
jgi:hypothetical protein